MKQNFVQVNGKGVFVEHRQSEDIRESLEKKESMTFLEPKKTQKKHKYVGSVVLKKSIIMIKVPDKGQNIYFG